MTLPCLSVIFDVSETQIHSATANSLDRFKRFQSNQSAKFNTHYTRHTYTHNAMCLSLNDV